jgi:signal transduction histidine kinase
MLERNPPKTKPLALSLRMKLTLWNTFVVLLVAVSSVMGLRFGLEWVLLKELAVALEDESYEISLAIREVHLNNEDELAGIEATSAGHIRHGWFLQILSPDGETVLWSSRGTPPQLEFARAQPDDRTLDLDGDQFRLAYERVRDADHPGYWLRVGASTAYIDRDIALLTRILLPLMIGIFVLSTVGGYFLAVRATKPLQRIIAKAKEIKPARLNERLPIFGTEDELDQLSREINHFLDQIADHLERNREFVANAAHELRSPVAAMATSIEVMLNRKRSTHDYEELLETIYGECQQLTFLVNRLLVLAEIETQQGQDASKLPVVPWHEKVQQSVEILSGVAEEKGVDLEIDLVPVYVHGEPTRLRQIINNLLDNAIKFTPSGGRVTVRLSRLPDPAWSLLEVRDTGIGISLKDQVRIFDRFYQVDTARQRDTIVHGTGLGLSICASVVELYGGEIQVHSRPGEGTTFQVRLPTCKPEVDASAVSPQATLPSSAP